MSKQEATRLADALERLLPLIERGTRGFVFTADKAGEVIADTTLLRDAPALLRQWPDGEPVCYQYLFDSPFGGEVWCDSPNNCNGNKPKASRALYTSPPDSAARIAELEAALKVAGDALEDVLHGRAVAVRQTQKDDLR